MKILRRLAIKNNMNKRQRQRQPAFHNFFISQISDILQGTLPASLLYFETRARDVTI